MSKNPELASLRQWIFAHNADSRGISISTAASTCQPGLLFSPGASLICDDLLIFFTFWRGRPADHIFSPSYPTK